jgi:hypothetical protein
VRCKLESVNEDELEMVDMLSLRPRLERLGVVSICFVGLTDLRPSSAASARARSSHLSRTVSRLVPGQCEGVHRLVAGTTGGLLTELNVRRSEGAHLSSSGARYGLRLSERPVHACSFSQTGHTQ